MPIPQIQVLVLSGADESRTQNRDESERQESCFCVVGIHAQYKKNASDSKEMS